MRQREFELYVKKLLEGLGENPSREGLRKTPKRWLAFMREFLSPPPFELTCFDSEGMDEMIVQTNIPFFSLCEHHLLPFFGVAAVAYVPNGKIVGLSKLCRTVEYYSRQLQNQERITQQTAHFLNNKLRPKGVGVVLKARHLCVEMRGIKKHDTYTTTSCLIGCFKTDHSCRSEFLSLALK